LNPIRFILTVPLLALPLLGGCWAYVNQVDPTRSLTAMIAALMVSLVATDFSYFAMHMGLSKGGARFMQYVSIGMGGKMMVVLFSVLIVLLFWPAVKYEFVGAFAVSYFVFTAYEVYGLMKANNARKLTTQS
jgi:hypothetical protein